MTEPITEGPWIVSRCPRGGWDVLGYEDGQLAQVALFETEADARHVAKLFNASPHPARPPWCRCTSPDAADFHKMTIQPLAHCIKSTLTVPWRLSEEMTDDEMAFHASPPTEPTP